MAVFFVYYLLGISLVMVSFLYVLLCSADKRNKKNVRAATFFMTILGIIFLSQVAALDNYRGRELLQFVFDFYAIRVPTPQMRIGETSVVLGVYNSINSEKQGERTFVVRLSDGQEARLTSKNFIDGSDVDVQVGDQLVRLREGVRPLNRNLSASSQ